MFAADSEATQRTVTQFDAKILESQKHEGPEFETQDGLEFESGFGCAGFMKKPWKVNETYAMDIGCNLCQLEEQKCLGKWMKVMSRKLEVCQVLDIAKKIGLVGGLNDISGLGFFWESGIVGPGFCNCQVSDSAKKVGLGY